MAFAIVEYALTKETRGAYLRELGASAAALGTPESGTFVLKAKLLLSLKLVVCDVGVMVLAGAALLSKRARAFFDVTARAAEQRVDEDDLLRSRQRQRAPLNRASLSGEPDRRAQEFARIE